MDRKSGQQTRPITNLISLLMSTSMQGLKNRRTNGSYPMFEIWSWFSIGPQGRRWRRKKCLNNAKFYFPRFAIGDFTFLTRGSFLWRLKINTKKILSQKQLWSVNSSDWSNFWMATIFPTGAKRSLPPSLGDRNRFLFAVNSDELQIHLAKNLN